VQQQIVTMERGAKDVEEFSKELNAVEPITSSETASPGIVLNEQQLHRGLKSRHIQFLALGGA